MELDFSKLNSLSFTAFREISSGKKSLKTPTEPILEPEGYKTTLETENALEELTEGLQGISILQRKADNNKAEKERALAVYREYQENIKTSSQLQTDILKGARAGEDIYSLFLKAVKAISLMTSNTLFYTQLEGDIRAIYGRGLQEAPAIDIELEQVVGRYIKLLEALGRETDGDSKDRIKRAITAHENRIRELEALKEKQGEAS